MEGFKPVEKVFNYLAEMFKLTKNPVELPAIPMKHFYENLNLQQAKEGFTLSFQFQMTKELMGDGVINEIFSIYTSRKYKKICKLS